MDDTGEPRRRDATRLCRKKEIPWFLQGLRAFAPEIRHEVADDLPAGERCGLLTD